eukprot:1091728-Heterocapsa_arctica.AAC.1
MCIRDSARVLPAEPSCEGAHGGPGRISSGVRSTRTVGPRAYQCSPGPLSPVPPPHPAYGDLWAKCLLRNQADVARPCGYWGRHPYERKPLMYMAASAFDP